MNLEQQVVSLDLAKKLKALGAKQESYFHWNLATRGLIQFQVSSPSHPKEHPNYVSAFTVAELGEMLPPCPRLADGKVWDLSMNTDNDGWEIIYSSIVREETLNIVFDKSEADARARMLIYLLENKLIEAAH